MNRTFLLSFVVYSTRREVTSLTTTKEKKFLKDAVAKKIFTDENCFDYTSKIIASTLNLDFDYVKNNLKLFGPNIASNTKTIDSEVDSVFLHDDFYMNIEINYSYYKDSVVKNTLYVAQLLLRQTNPGDNYNLTLPVIQININGYDLFGKGDFLYKSYIMDEVYHIKRDNLIEIYDINVDYLTKYDYNDVSGFNEEDLKYLLYIFVCENKREQTLIYQENQIMNEVFKKMEKLTSDFDGILYYDKKAFEERAAFHHGYDEGKKEQQLEIAKEMLNDKVPEETIAKYTSLSLEEIEELKKKLEEK